ncbi:cytochrome P450 [Lenzites betulinus]|nr:cytochrome P450 [Lenzites betulinus]
MGLTLSSITNIPCAFLICVCIMLYVRSAINWRSRTRGRPLPPGPRGLPLVGNVFSIPRYKPWRGFRDLSSKYGDMTYLEVCGQSVLVLSSSSAILELMEKRAANTSDRTQTPLIPFAGQGFNFAFMPYGTYWRRHRRAFWQQFYPDASEKYWPVQCVYARDFLAKLLDTPADLRRLIRYNFSGAIMKVVYNVDIKDIQDERIDIIDEAFIGLRELTVPVQVLLEFLPILGRLPSWMPGTGFARTITRSQAPNNHLVHVEFGKSKAAVEQGAGGPSVVSELLARMARSRIAGERQEDEEQIAKNVAAVTTVSTLEGCLIALALHPEVQKAAQAELDAIVGPDRLPDFDDRDKLVYVNAVLKEALRWHNVLPLGVAHKTVEDEEYRGYFIPAGTTLVGNVWECAHNPEVYPDPQRFYPERFIKDGKLDPNVLDPASLVFGWGRRICPGRYFADAGLFISIATVLHVFDVSGLLDGDAGGKPVKVELEMTHGFLSYPVGCRCSLKPRSAQAASLLRACSLSDALQDVTAAEENYM